MVLLRSSWCKPAMFSVCLRDDDPFKRYLRPHWGLKCFFSSTSSKDWALSQRTSEESEEFSDIEGQIFFKTFSWIKTRRQRKLAVWIYFLDVLLFIFVFHWVSKRPRGWRTFVLAFVASDVARHSCHLQVKWCMKVNIHLLWSKVLCDGSMMHAL